MHWHIVHVLWFHYAWPSDLGNGPESIQEMAVLAFITSLLYPPIRHAIQREIHRIHQRFDKMEHIAAGNPPEDFVEKDFHEFEHWVAKLGKWIIKPFGRAKV